MKINLDTYIISDTHFKHDNIIHYCNRPEDHDWLMELYWKSIVQAEDDILHLGDLMWYKNDTQWDDKKTLEDTMRELPGNKYLIKGNHDSKSNDFYESMGFTIAPKRMFFKHDDKMILFTHYPEKERFDWDINIHGHIHDRRRRLEYDGRLYINVSVEVMKYTPVQLKYILSGEV